MPTKSLARDRRLVSSQPHEIAYTAKTLGKNGRAAIVKAKKALGRNTSRKAVVSKARSLSGVTKNK